MQVQHEGNQPTTLYALPTIMYNRCTLTPICMHTLSAHDGRKSFWGSTTYASHEDLVTLNIFSWHWRASYNFSWPAVQYSLEVSLTRLYRTKPTWKTLDWTPTPAYFDIVPACMIRSNSQNSIYTCSHETCHSMPFQNNSLPTFFSQKRN